MGTLRALLIRHYPCADTDEYDHEPQLEDPEGDQDSLEPWLSVTRFARGSHLRAIVMVRVKSIRDTERSSLE